MAQSPEYPDLKWVPPKSWTAGRPAPPQVIVIHTTEGHEHAQAAEDGAAYDARRTDGTSTHYFVDPDSIVQCVRTMDRAHHARANGNRIGIGYELCGTAGQTDAQWADANSDAILRRAAKQAARDARKYNIPPVRLVPSQVRAGVKGFCGHVDITHAFPEDKGDHTDPGPRFPWSRFLSLVAAELGDEMTPDEKKQFTALQEQFAALQKEFRDISWQVRNVPSPDGQRRILTGAVGLAVEKSTAMLDQITLLQRQVAELRAASGLTEAQWEQVQRRAEQRAREQVAAALTAAAKIAGDGSP